MSHSKTTEYAYFDSPWGRLMLVGENGKLRRIDLPRNVHRGRGEPTEPEEGWRHDPVALHEPLEQLAQYFQGERQQFDLELDPEGTDFQLRVWQALCEIPFGGTLSYGEIAEKLGKPAAARAVGAANGRNPIAIVVPCHRVIGSDGTLTGYAGGLEIKQWLLQHEGVRAEKGQQTGLW